jgi:hypothetical protein
MGHEEAIQEAEDAVRQARENLDAIRPDFVAEAGRWLGTWWEEHVATVVRTQHERTTELGKDQLAELKADLRQQMDSSNEVVERWLSHEAAWPPAPMWGRALPKPLDTAMRRALGQVAPVLEVRGYKDESFERQGQGWRYRFAFDTSDATLGVVERAAQAGGALRAAEARLQEAQEAKARDVAGDLWDSA